jgi:hypothetical protein
VLRIYYARLLNDYKTGLAYVETDRGRSRWLHGDTTSVLVDLAPLVLALGLRGRGTLRNAEVYWAIEKVPRRMCSPPGERIGRIRPI